MNTGSTPRSVVVVMAKQPVAGRSKTRLSPPLSPAAAAQLYEAMLHDTIVLVSRVRTVRLAIAVTPAAALHVWRPQAPADAILLPVDGRNIGDCLIQATGRLFAGGFSRVIALNSDGPTLPPAHIEQAEALLGQNDIALGPSEDGGYYLVGLRKPRPDLFRDIAWSTAQVSAQTLARAASLGLSVAVLPTWYDIDTAAELDRLRAEIASRPPGVLTSTRRFFAGGGGRRRRETRLRSVRP